MSTLWSPAVVVGVKGGEELGDRMDILWYPLVLVGEDEVVNFHGTLSKVASSLCSLAK